MKLIVAALAFLLLFQSNSFASKAKKDDAPGSTIKSSDLIEYINQERDFLRGDYKVDLVSKFIRQSYAESKRYGNLKTVLNLKGLSLSGADLHNTTLTMANMVDVNLKNANLSGSDCVHVDFAGAELQGVNFSKADLSNANFVNTNLEDANFDGANLFKANFDKVTGLDKKTLAELKKRTVSYIDLKNAPIEEYYGNN